MLCACSQTPMLGRALSLEDSNGVRATFSRLYILPKHGRCCSMGHLKRVSTNSCTLLIRARLLLFYGRQRYCNHHLTEILLIVRSVTSSVVGILLKVSFIRNETNWKRGPEKRFFRPLSSRTRSSCNSKGKEKERGRKTKTSRVISALSSAWLSVFCLPLWLTITGQRLSCTRELTRETTAELTRP
jgi:hypothetical protein